MAERPTKRRPTRRGAAPAAGIALASLPLLAGCVQQSSRPGAETVGPDSAVWSEGPMLAAGALVEYRQAAEGSDDAVDWYNFGAALLITGDWEGSLPPLTRALDEEDGGEDLDESATYDLGMAHAVAGRPLEGAEEERPPGVRADPAERREHLLRARDAFRWVLRTDPAAEDARWNLELVDRWLAEEEPPPGAGGGAGESDDDSGGGGAGEGPPRMSAAQAQDILDQAAAAEMRVQGKRLQRNRARDPVVERNW